MNRLASAVSTVLAFSFTIGTGVPAAFAAPPMPELTASSDTVLVQQKRIIRRDNHRHQFERHGNSAYYNGHRGYRERRPGYRYYNGFWFPSAAFIAGAIVGGAINKSGRLSNAHVRWCHERWRSYRASDNTYQPLSGPRRACVSPYS